jgi:hypothetical protein
MTEIEWLKSVNPASMLQYFRNHAAPVSDRKVRLLVAACWAWLPFRYPDGQGLQLSELQLRVADSVSSVAELAVAIRPYFPDQEQSYDFTEPAEASIEFASNPWGAAWVAAYDAIRPADAKWFTSILRDIFGNPFRPVAFDPHWRSESAVALARTAYDTRNFTLLPILADALEEAGCDLPDVLTHCRDPNGVHVRGCWVVDGVLGKS